jgi:hypothetical protein
MNPVSRVSHSLHRHSSARGVLGENHPLVWVLECRTALVHQSVVVAVVLVVGSAAVIDEVGVAQSVCFAAAGSLCLYASVLLVVSQVIRDRAVDVIADGHATLPLPCVRSARRRLEDRGYRQALALCVDGLVREAGRARTGAWPGPLFSVAVVLSVREELIEIARLLRGAQAPVRPVAMTQRLLRDGASPLYQQDAGPLRDELRRIRFLLSVTW